MELVACGKLFHFLLLIPFVIGDHQATPYGYQPIPQLSGQPSPQHFSQATSLLRLLGLQNGPSGGFILPKWPGGWTLTQQPSAGYEIQQGGPAVPQFGSWINTGRPLLNNQQIQAQIQFGPEQLKNFLVPQPFPATSYGPEISTQPQVFEQYGQNFVAGPSPMVSYPGQLLAQAGLVQPTLLNAQPNLQVAPAPSPVFPVPVQTGDRPVDHAKSVYGVYPLQYGVNYVSPYYDGALYYGGAPKPVLPQPVPLAPAPFPVPLAPVPQPAVVPLAPAPQPAVQVAPAPQIFPLVPNGPAGFAPAPAPAHIGLQLPAAPQLGYFTAPAPNVGAHPAPFGLLAPASPFGLQAPIAQVGLTIPQVAPGEGSTVVVRPCIPGPLRKSLRAAGKQGIGRECVEDGKKKQKSQ